SPLWRKRVRGARRSWNVGSTSFLPLIHDPDIAVLHVGEMVMRLELDRPRLGAPALSRVDVRRSPVGEVNPLTAVDPRRHVRPAGDQRHAVGAEVAAEQPRWVVPRLAGLDSARRPDDRLRHVAIDAAVVDLRLVALHEVARHAAAEGAAVGLPCPWPDVDLQYDVAIVLLLVLQYSRAARRHDRPGLDAPFRTFILRGIRPVDALPPLQSLAVEDRLQVERLDDEHLQL